MDRLDTMCDTEGHFCLVCKQRVLHSVECWRVGRTSSSPIHKDECQECRSLDEDDKDVGG